MQLLDVTMNTPSQVILLVVTILELIICASGGYIHHHQSYEENHHEPAHYDFQYKVHDPHTGDEKTHHETNAGGVVKGFYSLKEADGTVREVHYTADKHHGFQAEVKKIGHPIHPPPQYHKHQSYHY